MAKEKDKDGKDEVEEITIVTDRADNMEVVPEGTDDEGAPEPVEIKDKKSKGKQKEEPEDDEDEDEDDDEDQEDTRLGKNEDKSDEAEEDERKGKTHKSRRQRRKEAENRLRTELKFLETRNDQLERQVQDFARRLDTGEKATLEARITHVKALIAKAEGVMAEAADADKGGKELVEATRLRDNLRDDLKKLETVKEQNSDRGGDRQAKVDPRVVTHATSWQEKNDWFDFGGRDADSRIVRALDDALADEGFDPTKKSYWQELDKRVAKYLPHRAKKKGQVEDTDEDDDEDEDEEERPQRKQAKRKAAPQNRGREDDADDVDDEDKGKPKKSGNGAGGPRFRTGGPGRELKPNEVYLSRERIEAMKEAGVWDDPVLRNKHLKRYQQYDRDHSNERDR